MKRPAAGFTLLEMVVATAIMGLAVVGLLSNLSVSLNTASRLAARDRAVVLAHEKLEQMLADREFTAGSEAEDKFDAGITGGVEAGWKAKSSIFEAPPNAQPGMAVLERIEVEVWWMEASSRRKIALNGYRRGVIPVPQPQSQ
ncbi:MAG: type IV pilus modification PilV family protein [bacterium]|jgi:general secretion pathway protein I